MAPQLKVSYGEQQQVAIAAEALGVVRKLQDTKQVIKSELNLPEEEYNLYDAHGLIENDIDLQRCFHKFNKGDEDCEIEIRNSWEHNHFMRIRRLEEKQRALEDRILKVEGTLTSSDEKTGFVGHWNKIEDLQKQMLAVVDRVVVTEHFPSKVHEPAISAWKLARDQDLKAIEELTQSSKAHAAEALGTMARVNNLDAAIKEIMQDHDQTKQELLGVSRSLDESQGRSAATTQENFFKKGGWSSKDELNLKFLVDGQTVSMKVETTDTIALVKAMLQGKMDYHRKQQALSFEGKPLEDDQLVSHYNLPSFATVQVTVGAMKE